MNPCGKSEKDGLLIFYRGNGVKGCEKNVVDLNKWSEMMPIASESSILDIIYFQYSRHGRRTNGFISNINAESIRMKSKKLASYSKGMQDSNWLRLFLGRIRFHGRIECTRWTRDAEWIRIFAMHKISNTCFTIFSRYKEIVQKLKNFTIQTCL